MAARFVVLLLALGAASAERRLLQAPQTTAATNLNPATITVNQAPFDVIATPITPNAPYSQKDFQCNVSGDSRIPGAATYPLTVKVPVGQRVRVIFANGNLNGAVVTQQGEAGVIVQQGGVIVQQVGGASPIIQQPGSPIVQQPAPPAALVVQQTPTVIQQNLPPPAPPVQPPPTTPPPTPPTPPPPTPPTPPPPTPPPPPPTPPPPPPPTPPPPPPPKKEKKDKDQTWSPPPPNTWQPTNPPPNTWQPNNPPPNTWQPTNPPPTNPPPTNPIAANVAANVAANKDAAANGGAAGDNPAAANAAAAQAQGAAANAQGAALAANLLGDKGRKLLQDRVPGGPNNGLVEYVALASSNSVPGFVVPNTQFGVPYVEFTASAGSAGQTATFKGVLEVAQVVGGVPQYPFKPNPSLSPECQVNVNFVNA